MKSKASHAAGSASGQGDSPPGDALAALQLRVARRADELVRAGMATSDLKLVCWLQAEQEILHRSLLSKAGAALERRA